MDDTEDRDEEGIDRNPLYGIASRESLLEVVGCFFSFFICFSDFLANRPLGGNAPLGYELVDLLALEFSQPEGLETIDAPLNLAGRPCRSAGCEKVGLWVAVDQVMERLDQLAP